jgi:hypothetical protein
MRYEQLSPDDQEWARQDWLDDLERQWRESQPRLTDRQLLDIFPDVKQDLPDIINELETEDRYLKFKIGAELMNITSVYKTQIDQIIAREGLKRGLGQDLLANRRQLSRLWRLKNLASGNIRKKGGISDQDIQDAMEVPIETLFDGQLRKSGKTLIGLCPFHSEKHASFYIYPATNSYYCFGCNCGGNSINFLMNLNGLDFKSAVKLLTNS